MIMTKNFSRYTIYSEVAVVFLCPFRSVPKCCASQCIIHHH